MEKEITINELFEFLQENMVTKDDLSDLRSEMRSEFGLIRAELEDIKEQLFKPLLDNANGRCPL